MPSTATLRPRTRRTIDQVIDGHLYLRDLVHDLEACLASGRDPAWRLVALRRFLETMAPREEDLMARYGHPEINGHRTSHRLLMRLLDDAHRSEAAETIVRAIRAHCCRDDGILAVHLLHDRWGIPPDPRTRDPHHSSSQVGSGS